MRWKYYGIILFCICFMGTACQKKEINEIPAPESVGQVVTEGTTKDNTIQKIGETLPVSRGLAAKMISLTFLGEGELSAMEEEIAFTDVKKDDWYYRYINGAVALGYMQGSGDVFFPLEPLSLYEAQVLLKKINRTAKTQIKITEENRDKAVSYALWMELFQKAVGEAMGEDGEAIDYGLQEKTLYVYATPANSIIAPWTMATDQGQYRFEGFSVDAYIDKKISCFVKDNSIVSITGEILETPILTNAYIAKKEQEACQVLIGGVSRTIPIAGTIAIEAPMIADMKIEENRITQLTPIPEMKTGIIKKAGSSGIELEEAGTFPVAEDIKFYQEKQGEILWKGYSSLLCGTEVADFYWKNGKICAAVIRREAKPDTIRVVLSSVGGNGYFHKEVRITCKGPFTVKNESGSRGYEANSEFILLPQEENGRTYLQPERADTPLIVQTMEQENGFIPAYYGKLEVEKRGEGFVLVNEVALERYLCGVVPSEMPTKYGLEAAKVQAVTARSYAYNQFYANKYHEYGANVDDSTLCQVYNAIGESEISSEGVQKTEGICLTYQGEVISANFFSTGAGVRANSGEVWLNTTTKKFPSDTLPYLRAARDYTGDDYGDLSQEENAKAFFKASAIDSFDSNFCWFRWVTRMTCAELSAQVNANLLKQWESSPYTVKTKQADGIYRSRKIETIGDIIDISVKKRGEAGNVMELMIKGTKAEVLIVTEYAIRKLLAPMQKIQGGEPVLLTCYNGVTFKNYSLLPSAFFVLEKDKTKDGGLRNIIIFGGGNGHGVGMSQNGVKGMIDQGYSYEEILQYYYPETECKMILEN